MPTYAKLAIGHCLFSKKYTKNWGIKTIAEIMENCELWYMRIWPEQFQLKKGESSVTKFLNAIIWFLTSYTFVAYFSRPLN